RFRIEAKLLSNGHGAVYSLVLMGAGGERHYSANAVLHAAPQGAPVAIPATASLEPGKGEVYGGVLFHGREFQAIRELEGVSREGGAARLVGAQALGWQGAFETDPALLDGGLQLALLWTEHAIGGASLPTSVQGFHVYSQGLAEGDLRCILTARETNAARGICDLFFVDQGGKPVAELRGVQTHVLPGTR
ncbi:MAG: polyketide synthase dehydratase domain-containing protein, partial [Polyangiaceae bacterium]|nr:polyketide synthase dehydratase domain-containing protein [Polyangiaceae bacterium]